MKLIWTRLKFALAALSYLPVLTHWGHADSLDSWSGRSPLPTGNGLLQHCAYGNGQYVILGRGAIGSTILTSSDGLNWAANPVTNEIAALSFGDGIFLGVGANGLTLTSLDGISWQQHDPAQYQNARGTKYASSQFNFSGIVHGEGQFLATASRGNDLNSGALLVSTIGVDWVVRQLKPGYLFSSVTYADGQYLALAWHGLAEGVTNVLLSSLDTVTWQEEQLPSAGQLVGLALGGGRWVTVGFAGTILISADRVVWRQPFSGTTALLQDIAFGGGQFIAVGDQGTILRSLDGLTWTAESSGTQNPLRTVAYVNGQFVAAGDDGTLLTSFDGLTWNGRNSGVRNPLPALSGIAYGGGKFVAVGWDGGVTSSDGVSWTQSQLFLPDRLAGVAYGQQQFVAVGTHDGIDCPPKAVITASSDGKSWVRTLLRDVHAWLTGVTFGQDRFVAVGYSSTDGAGVLLSSPDGVSWTQQLAPTHPETVPPPRLWGIGYGNGQFVAVGDSGTILTSPDGSNWTRRPSRSVEQLYGVAFGNGQIVVSGGDGALLTSIDGVTWVPRRSGTADLLQGLAFGSGQFVAVGWGSGTIVTSRDGANWERHRSPAGQSGLTSVAYGPDGRFVAVGPGSTIVQSDPVITLAAGLDQTTGLLSLAVEAPAGKIYTIQSSPDLRNWSALTNLNGTLSLELPNAAAGRVFYRALSQ